MPLTRGSNPQAKAYWENATIREYTGDVTG